MPEGHTVHRTANDFRRLLVGKPVRLDSPQGRFSTGAQALSGQVLTNSYAIGKQLFLDFANGQTIRIHLGIFGKWRWYKNIDVAAALKEPVVGEVRARFFTDSMLADLRGPTICEVLVQEQVEAIKRRLGPDPLNPDLDGSEYQRFAKRVAKSKTAIGLLLMDQSVISGIGNVYRAEILFRAGIDPYTPGSSLRPKQIEGLWNDSVDLLAIGVKTGYIITRDELFTTRPTKAERNFVYKREGQDCRNCGKKVSIALAAGRKLYWCPKCQK
jgi:DNA-formamidopyrimidine glycosylase